MKRKLFCEISPITYKISMEKEILLRKIKDMFLNNKFAKEKIMDKFPIIIYKHNSLIRRKLGNVNMQLQENKAKNLSLAAPKISGIIIKPGEIFSFWSLVGRCLEKDGYREGLTIASGKPSSGIGGGMCQLTNLIHWMILHSDMEIVEHHHHDQIDLFPDYKRVIPFGTGTSIVYNYLDYRFKNNTDLTYQLIIYVTDEYLCGELRSDKKQDNKYHVVSEDVFFSKEKDGIVYRNGKIYRIKNDCETGKCINKELIRVNHAKVCYDTSNLDVIDLTK
jgi:vancomycin resistance protein VanW